MTRPAINGYSVCEMCGAEKPEFFEPTRSQLLFGGFPVKMEYRCKKCEAHVAEWVETMLDNISKH